VEEVHHFGHMGDDTDLITSAYHPSGHVGEIAHFADCVLNDKPPLTPGEEGCYALECAWAAILSFRTHQPVTLPLKKPYPSY
jgi:predicted dehydrogenase